MKRFFLAIFLIVTASFSAQNTKKELSPTPPMGFMTWNFFGSNIHEKDIKEMADAMVELGLVELGYNYMCIDDGWQGGRDNKNNLIADPNKFPSGIKALADYLHQRGMKLGMYSDAAPLTCDGYTGSFHFEEQDAKTFAQWGTDYLKYDYCNAPTDTQTAKQRYEKMAKALKNSGRDIVFAICEWGDRNPVKWASQVGGHLWRTTADIRDKWSANKPLKHQTDLHGHGAGILDILNINAELDEYSGVGRWNDPDMLIVGLYGKKGPSGGLGGTGCTDTEYQSQMSLWCLMASPLMITCDVRNMNQATKNILMNKDVIAINQDKLGIQAKRVINHDDWQVFVKPLEGGKKAIGVLNTSSKARKCNIPLKKLGIDKKAKLFDVWTKKTIRKASRISQKVNSHETLVFVVE